MQMDECKELKKNSPLRQKLVKLMNYLKEQQEQLISLNDDADKKNHIYNKIRHEFENIKRSLKNDEEWLNSNEAKDFKQLEQVELKLIESKDKLKSKKKELEELIKDIESLSAKLNDIRIRINKGKKEYARIKQKYDEETDQIQKRCDEIKAKIDELESKMDKSLLNRYKGLKSSHITAMAVVEQNRCGGCNMSLASLVIQRVKERDTVVECENCGRILYYCSQDADDS